MAALLVALACGLATGGAHGQATNAATAEQLFEDAKLAMAQGRYAEACPKLAESHRLDPATGGTLLNLAVCNEKLGKLATAWAEYEEAAALARHFARADREQYARERSAALLPRLSRLSLRVDDRNGRVPGFRIALDAAELGKLAWTDIPIDPGEHTLDASAPGKVGYSERFTIAAEPERRTLSVPALKDPPAAQPATPGPAATARAPEGPPPSSSRRTTGVVIVAIGVAALGAGSFFGVSALTANADSKNECAGGCSKAGADDSRRALLYANLANVGIGVGVVAVAVGAYLALTAGPSASKSASALRIAPFGLGGAF